MKISTKIVLLVGTLLTLLAIDGFISYRLIKSTGVELKGVVNQDVVLMQTATAITRHQLEKAVVFERVRRIVEELAFQETTAARKEHLVFHTKLAKGNFDELSKEGAINIVNGKLLVDSALKSVEEPAERDKLKRVADVLKEIEKAHIHYDSLVGEMFNAVLTGKYDFSEDELSQVHRDEKKMSTELQNLADAVQRFTQDSLAKANRYDKTAEKILWLTLFLSLLIGTILAVSIIRGIAMQLRSLVKASHRIGEGDLKVNLDEKSRDEFGELSRAFNKMSSQLFESQKRLEDQSQVLRKNLQLTDQQKKDLEKINHELDRFVHTVSHDIRSPLMGIAWYADFLKKQHSDKLDQKGRDCVDGVNRGVERCNALIHDLLALTRLSRIQNPYQYVSISGIIDEVLGNLEYKIKQNRVDIRLQPNMPTIICDGIKMKEVFLNLINNAIKFSSGNEGRQPVIEVFYRKLEDAHEFYVKDNGIGIHPRHHAEVFDMFKRLDTAEKYEGTGAGLSIVKSIVEDHGGRVWVVSEEGKGAELHFSIPSSLAIGKA